MSSMTRDEAAPDPGCGRALALCLLLLVLARVPELVKPPLVDQSNFQLVAREMARGRVLYRDLFDVKPPLIFWFYRGLAAIGADREPWPVVVDAVLAVVTVLLAHRALRSVLHPRALGLGLLLWGFLGSYAWFAGRIALLQPETLVNLLAVLALGVGMGAGRGRGPGAGKGTGKGGGRGAGAGGGGEGKGGGEGGAGARIRHAGWGLWLGMLAGLAALAKLVPGAMVLGMGVLTTPRGARWRVLSGSAALAVAMMALWLGGLVASGSWEGFREALAYGAFYRGLPLREGLGPLADLLPALLPPALGLLPVIAFRSSHAPPGVLVFWFVAAGLTILAQGKFWGYHFLAVLPPLALLAGHGLHALQDRLGRAIGMRVIFITLLAGLGATLHSQIALNVPAFERLAGRLSPERHALNEIVTWGYTAAEVAGVADRIRDRTGPDDPVLVFGIMPQVHLWSDRRPAGRYLFHYYLLAKGRLSKGFGDLARRRAAFLDSFRRDPPAAVVVPDSQSPQEGVFETARELRSFRALDEILATSYREERQGRIRIFFRADRG